MRIAITALAALVAASPAWAGPPTPEQKAFKKKLDTAKPSPKFYDFEGGTVEGKLGTRRMRDANRAAAEIIRKRMARTRQQDAQLLSLANEVDTIVVAGRYDRVQDILKALDVAHVVIPPHLVDRLPLMATQTLMINCGSTFSRKAIEKVADFVARGGHLVTTDWALKVTQAAFPNTVRHNGISTGNDVLPVTIHTGDDPLLAHVKVVEAHPRWWLEQSSYPIQVLNRRKVKVLMSSRAMKKRYKHGAVVVAFEQDLGRVVHMTSHFYLQQSKRVEAAERRKGSRFARKAGLTRKEIHDLKARGIDVDKVAVGDLNSAFVMQQLMTNLVVAKTRANEKLMKRYALVLTRTVQTQGSARLERGFRVRVLSSRPGRKLVQDLFGTTGWVPDEAVRDG